jgi:hypothetical protein
MVKGRQLTGGEIVELDEAHAGAAVPDREIERRSAFAVSSRAGSVRPKSAAMMPAI